MPLETQLNTSAIETMMHGVGDRSLGEDSSERKPDPGRYCARGKHFLKQYSAPGTERNTSLDTLLRTLMNIGFG